MNAVGERGRNDGSPRVSIINRFSLGVENEWADGERDDRTLLARLKFLRYHRSEWVQDKSCFPSSADPFSDWQPHPVDPHLGCGIKRGAQKMVHGDA